MMGGGYRFAAGRFGTHRGEAKRVNLDTEGGHVLLLKFTSQVSLDEGSLSRSNPSLAGRSTSRLISP
jgi:hypothetical protein